MPRYYPVHLDIEDTLCVVIGGGQVAARKADGLLEAGARVRIVSPEIATDLRWQADEGRIEFVQSGYEAAHLKGAALAIAATNSREVNRQVAVDAGALRIPVNVVDAPEEGNFIVPALVRRGEFCLSISTGGNNPLLAARLQRELETKFGPEYGDFVELLGQMREAIKARTNDVAQRRHALSVLLDNEDEIRRRIVRRQTEEARALAYTLLDSVLPPRSLE